MNYSSQTWTTSKSQRNEEAKIFYFLNGETRRALKRVSKTGCVLKTQVKGGKYAEEGFMGIQKESKLRQKPALCFGCYYDLMRGG